MKPVSIIIVLSVTQYFILCFNKNVLSGEIVNKLIIENDKLIDANKKLIDENNNLINEDKTLTNKNEKLIVKIIEQINKIKETLKFINKDETKTKKRCCQNMIHIPNVIDNYLYSKLMEKQPKLNLSSQLAEAKEKCWNVRLLEPRMVNGSNPPTRDASTWMVAIFQQIDNLPNDNKYICGGCIISSWYVLTAAQCFLNSSRYWYAKDYDMLSVRYGVHDLSSEIYSESGVLKVHIHPDYWITTGFFSDIALVKLKKTIKYTKLVSPICIPFLTTPTDWFNIKLNTSVLLSGWGQTAPDNWPQYRISTHLLKGTAYLVDQRECNEAFAENFTYNPASTLCVGQQTNASKLCDGDTGSPVVPLSTIPGSSKIEFPVVMGIVSVGDKRCQGYYLLTNVAFYFEWLNRMTAK